MAKPVKILVFPKDQNPYQRLLYSQLGSHLTVTYLSGDQHSVRGLATFMPLLTVRLLWYRLRGYRAIHIHWLYPFYTPAKLPLHRQITYWQIRSFFGWLRLLRYRIIWTVHNVVPQIAQTRDDEGLMRILAHLAHAKIVHANAVIASMTDHHLDTDRISIIPHGNYVGVYPDTVTPQQARAQLGLAPDDIVILFFGRLAAYKGIDRLLDAFRHINNPAVRLVIAGECHDASLHRSLQEASQDARIDYYEGAIADDQVSTYFASCDVVCLPFSTITTSGSTILALSFGKPIVVPRLGALRGLPETVGYFYDPSDPQALTRSLAEAVGDPAGLRQRGQAARRYADTLSWAGIARQTHQVYQAVLAEPASTRPRTKNNK